MALPFVSAHLQLPAPHQHLQHARVAHALAPAWACNITDVPRLFLRSGMRSYSPSCRTQGATPLSPAPGPTL
eukprot:720683-Pelagomonas_calceolata.AAC.2